MLANERATGQYVSHALFLALQRSQPAKKLRLLMMQIAQSYRVS